MLARISGFRRIIESKRALQALPRLGRFNDEGAVRSHGRISLFGVCFFIYEQGRKNFGGVFDADPVRSRFRGGDEVLHGEIAL